MVCIPSSVVEPGICASLIPRETAASLDGDVYAHIANPDATTSLKRQAKNSWMAQGTETTAT